MPENMSEKFKIGASGQDAEKFKIGTNPTWMQEATRNPVDLLNQDEDPDRQIEYDSFVNQEMKEERGKSDPDLNRLVNAETVEDVASALDTFKEGKDFDYAEADDSYSGRRMLSSALKRARILARPASYLMDPRELIVVKSGDVSGGYRPGVVRPDGYLDEGSRVRVDGYSIRVENIVTMVDDVETHVKYVRNADGARTGEEEVTEVRRKRPQRAERVYFGKPEERYVLSKAHLEFVRQGITGDKTYQHANLMWSMRAALETLVKTAYLKGVSSSNAQNEWFFSAPDIRELNNSPENTDLGDKRSKTIRILGLLGNCETKEKLEKHLNTTFNVEEILDVDTQNRVLGMMKEFGKITNEELETMRKVEEKKGVVSERYKKVIEFLIGKNITITPDGPEGVYRYELGQGWLTGEERDPSKTNIPEEKKKRGKNGIKAEKSVRGWWTQFGNPYVRDRDTMQTLLVRSIPVVGDADAVFDADRKFYWWGEKDWLGLEVYAPGAIPTGEDLLETRNKLDFDEWKNDYAPEIQSYFAKGGEPVGTDLVKLMHTDFYRLGDQLGQRPTGPLITVDKFPHLTQSLMGLCRSDVEVNGKVRTRKIRERFYGSKDNELGNEKAVDLGKIGWQKINTPQFVLEQMVGEDVGTIDWKDVKVPEKLKKQIQEYAEGKTAGLAKELEKSFNINGSAIGAGAEDFLWLMNFLTGEENEKKRPWAFINAPLDPGTLTTPDGFTAKVKFVEITQKANGSFDDYKEVEKRANAAGRTLDEQVDLEANERISKMLKDWYKGVQSDPMYPTWQTKLFDYRLYSLDEKGGNEEKTSKTTWNNIVEGTSPDKTGLAVRYGFLDKSDVNEKVAHRDRIIR